MSAPRLSSLPIDVNPEDVAVDMLKAELPGFETMIVGARDALGIRGALPISTEVSRELILWPIMRSPHFVDVKARAFFDALETDDARAARHAQQREALKRELEPTIAHITERVRRFAIDAVGLEPVIAERERVARLRGEREGYEAGRRQGRADAMREWAETMQELRQGIAAVLGSDDDE